jgi:hypothetical protein
MKKTLSIVVLGLLLTLPAGLTYSQERPQERAPRERGGQRGVPDGPMGGNRNFRGTGLMMHNPKLAAMMMEMRGEMMRIRGEAMVKQGDVLKRYGERFEKERAE